MKSFVAYPMDFEKILFPDPSENSYSGKLIAHYELYRKVNHLRGSLVKCGITARKGLTRLALFRNLMSTTIPEKVVAFEKLTRKMYLENGGGDNGVLQYKTTDCAVDHVNLKHVLKQNEITENVDFVPGNVGDTIPYYLIENPDLKISYLNIDFDDYESTLTTLQFFYPRLVQGGILILDNYYKKEEDHDAANDYFQFLPITVNCFSVDKGPHYIVRN